MLEEEYQPRRKRPTHPRPATEPEPVFEYRLRDATEQDLPHVREIYNHYVLNSTVTFDESQSSIVLRFVLNDRIAMRITCLPLIFVELKNIFPSA